jgi:hypothetical protein
MQPLGMLLAAATALTLAAQSAGAGSRGASPEFSLKLVFVQRNLRDDRQVAEIRDIVVRSSRLGFNGIVLSAWFDGISLQGEDFHSRLQEVKGICDENRMELIPLMFSGGYASGVLAHDRNLAAAVPLKSVPFVMAGGRSVLVRDGGIGISNGGLERVEGERFDEFDLQDGPGKTSRADRTERKEGALSIRFENASRAPGGMGRLMQRVKVHPFRCYKVTLSVKTQDLEPPGRFQVAVMTGDGRVLMTYHPSLEPTNDWTDISLGFNCLSYEEVLVYAGVWNGPTGRFWLDDLRMEEEGMINVVRRPGTPVDVRNARSGAAYREGVDFKRIEDPVLSYKLDHDAPVVQALPGGNLKEGDRILVDCYQALALGIPSGQTGVCLSEPRVYEIWTEATGMVHDAIAPRHYFVSMDEVRQGGWCQACERRGLTAGEILGDCITRQSAIIHEIDPGAEILVWSDMLDPNHNATKDYYLINGDLSRSWEHIPRDLIIAGWRYDTLEKSLGHFGQLGFRTIGCGYYDRDNTREARDWVAALGKTPGACGIMYTTWKGRYEFLEPFARIAVGGGESEPVSR